MMLIILGRCVAAHADAPNSHQSIFLNRGTRAIHSRAIASRNATAAMAAMYTAAVMVEGALRVRAIDLASGNQLLHGD